RQPMVLALRPAIHDCHVLALDIAGVLQAKAECAQTVRDRVRRPAIEETDHRHRRLLRSRSERPRGRCAEYAEELTPFHRPMPPVLPAERIAHRSYGRSLLRCGDFGPSYVGLGSDSVIRRCRLNVRFGPLCGLKSDISRGPRSAK